MKSLAQILFSLATLTLPLNGFAADFGTDKIGQVRSYNFQKGVGYIAPLRGGAAILFRGSWGISDLTDGACVRYDVQESTDHRREAVNLRRAQCY